MNYRRLNAKFLSLLKYHVYTNLGILKRLIKRYYTKGDAKMKIFCFVGSNSKKSIGAYIADILNSKFEKNGDIEFYKYIFRERKVDFCIGCKKCFNEEYCPIDAIDYFDELKKHMLKANVIIWITPVYAVNVSGAMKNFIDRIAYILCEKNFNGKMGIGISVTDSSGMDFTNFYITNLMKNAGCDKVKSYEIVKIEGEVSQRIEEVTNQVLDVIRNRIECGDKL